MSYPCGPGIVGARLHTIKKIPMSVSHDTSVIFGQPSWRFATSYVEAYLTRQGGHLGPVSFHFDNRTVVPYALCPWAEENIPGDLPSVLKVLRGDFFCMPFGANDTAFGTEHHPPHGESANRAWKLETIFREGDVVTLCASLDTSVRSGHIDKQISLCEGHHAIYVRHIVSGMSGQMSLGHHAMLKFPQTVGSGIISTSPFLYAQTAPQPIESPQNQGYSLLQPDSCFTSLSAVPTITGELTDLSRFPARKGFEDLVMLVSDPSADLSWTAVTFPEEGYVWFALKDPLVLKQTVFWLSNGGRYYSPWNGRHTSVMGLEEVTSYFHYGISQSAEQNTLTDRGYETCLHLDSEASLDVRYIMAVAEIPDGFSHVKTIRADTGRGGVLLESINGKQVDVKLNLDFLQLT